MSVLTEAADAAESGADSKQDTATELDTLPAGNGGAAKASRSCCGTGGDTEPNVVADAAEVVAEVPADTQAAPSEEAPAEEAAAPAEN